MHNRFSNFAYSGSQLNGPGARGYDRDVTRKRDSDDDNNWLEIKRPGNSSSTAGQRTTHGESFSENGSITPNGMGRIPKKRTTRFNVDEDDVDLINTPMTMQDILKKKQAVPMREILSKKSKLVRDSLMDRSLDDLEEYDPLDDKRSKVQEARSKDRLERILNRNSAVVSAQDEDDNVKVKGRLKKRLLLDSDEDEPALKAPKSSATESAANAPAKKKAKKSSKKYEEVIDLDGDDDDNGREDDDEDDNGYRDDTEDDIYAQANEVIKQCEIVSRNLKKSLLEWQGGEKAESVVQGSSGNSSKVEDCVNLTSIVASPAPPSKTVDLSSSSPSSSLLSNDDIAAICPGLALNPYQLVGVNWLKLLYENEVNGVLADDMGLGKTVQTIAFLGWLAQVALNTPRVKKPHLIVVPASVLSNWENELARFCPSLEVVRYHGSLNEKAELREQLRRSIPQGEVDVIITTYTLFERESNAKDRSFLWNQKFNFLILDEAHSIKNADSQRYSHLNAMRTKHRLLLSGTPVQNDLSELLALLSFLMPTVFGRDNCEAMMQAFGWSKDRVAGSAAAGAVVGPSTPGGLSLNQLKAMLAPFVLRRLKRDVLDHLSEKTTCLQLLPLELRQKQIYEDIILSYADRKQRLAMKAQTDLDESKLLEGKLPAVGSGNNNRKKRGAASTAVAAAPEAKVVAQQQSIISSFNKLKKSDSCNQSSSVTIVDLLTDDVTSNFTTNNKRTRDPETIDGNVIIDLNDDSSDSPSDEIGPSATTQSEAATKGQSGASIVRQIVQRASSLSTTSNHLPPNTNTEALANELRTLSNSEAKHLFTALRKAANHPLLLRVHYHNGETFEKIVTVVYNEGYFGFQVDRARARAEMETFSDFDIHQLCLQYERQLGHFALDSSVLYDSPKMRFLETLLPTLQQQGHRMLIFSQWTRLLDLLEVFLNDMGMVFLRLDGSTPIKERQELIDTFNTDASIPVFLLSTKAGGLGINLTAADTVILHDLDFNPENDKQAEVSVILVMCTGQ